MRYTFAVGIIGLLSGCAAVDGTVRTQGQPLPDGVLPPSTYISLKKDEPVQILAGVLDKVATERSAAVQEVRAARARLLARRYDQFPQVRPTGSVALNGENEASLGLSIEQVIWDGGRTRARLGDATLGVAEAGLRAWTVRNEDVFEGLKSYVDMSRYRARLRAYTALEANYEELASLLEVRASGGVADRGEALRMNLARQELQRDIVADTAALRGARSDLMRFLPSEIDIRPLRDLADAASSCERSWPESEAPLDALARVRVSRSRLNEDLTEARRFPRLVLGAGAAVTNAASGITPGVNVNLDASDMLGLGGARAIEAAILDSQAALATYNAQREDTRAELSRLEANYTELQAGLRQLRDLQKANREAVDLYTEQLDAGSIPLTEGIALYREVADTDVDIIDFQADILINCLQSSQFRGLLAPFTDPGVGSGISADE